MNSICKYLLLAFISFAPFHGFANDIRVATANNHFLNNDFEKAIQAYEDILNSGYEAPEIFYNLGNAYYRIGNLAAAILNYERALLRAPHDKDSRYNLELAYSQITDKIAPVGEFFLSRWLTNFQNSTSSDTWAVCSIVFFVLALGGILLYFIGGTMMVKKIAFFVALIGLFISAITFTFSGNQKQQFINREKAIIFEPSVTVRSTPNDSGMLLFVLHAGTKVRILQSIGEWREIEIADGNVGWVHFSQIEII